MLKGKVVLGVLAVTGILAMSATAAHAGAGTPVALFSFFVCHTANGTNLGREVDVYSDEAGGGTSARTAVTIGQLVLSCAQATLLKAGGTPATPPAVSPDEISPKIPLGTNPETYKTLNELKCYSASTNRKSGDSALLDVQDALWGGLSSPPAPSGTETGVSVARDIRLICGPAFFSQ